MGLFRIFFDRKPAAPPEVWTPTEPRAGLGLPPIEVPGRAEPGAATPGGYRPAYREDIEIPPVPTGERWAPDWAGEQEFEPALPEDEPEAPDIEAVALAPVEAEAAVPEADPAEPEFESEAEREPEPESAEVEPEPEPELIETEAEHEREPEPVEAEAEPEPEPVETKAEAESEPEPEPVKAEVEPELAPMVPPPALIAIEAPAEPRAPVRPPVVRAAPQPVYSVTPTRRGPDIRTILAEIETLGDSPELGLLRRALGAEPDGLFGFSTMYPAALIRLLQSRFAGTGELENLATKTAWGYHYIVDTRYDFSWKTDIQDGEMDDAAVLQRESSRLIALREQLIDHLSGNERLFVYAGPATYEQIAAIRAAMRNYYGTNTLLHLVPADAELQPGQVVWRQDGLLRGALSHYGSNNGRWDIAKDDWAQACLTAHQRWKPFIRRQ